MPDETYKGVSIAVEPANLATNSTGHFTLAWPGHEERIKSQHRQASFILQEAKSFIDDWLADGYIKLSALPEDKLALLQDGDYVQTKTLGKVNIRGPIRLQDGAILYRSKRFDCTISIQQHTIKAIIRNGETIHRFD